MTSVAYEQEGDVFRLAVLGHAGYAEDGGPDIVCSAVSMLCCTVVRCMEEARECEDLVHLELVVKSGEVRVECEAALGCRERLEEVFRVILVGFGLLQEKYPGVVDLRKSK